MALAEVDRFLCCSSSARARQIFREEVQEQSLTGLFLMTAKQVVTGFNRLESDTCLNRPECFV